MAETEAVIDIESIQLESGGHEKPEDGMCVMEAFTYVNRLPFSDQPECVCPTLAAFLRHWNDEAVDADRQELKRYIPRLMGTNDGKSDARAWLLIDCLLRERLPEVLDTIDDAKAKECAARLRGLSQIKGGAELELAILFINATRALDLDLA
ncbi:MAG TPA: hypothetical protein VHC90_09690, partial [Bryobacteraceae bacterium]|nr:hypothetical protein [Bryobacteraceae bacterium]